MAKRRMNSDAMSTPTPVHEYTRNASHRIVCGDLIGQWHTYQQIATLKTPTGVLHACTDYYHGSLPTNCVFRIEEIH